MSGVVLRAVLTPSCRSSSFTARHDVDQGPGALAASVLYFGTSKASKLRTWRQPSGLDFSSCPRLGTQIGRRRALAWCQASWQPSCSRSSSSSVMTRHVIRQHLCPPSCLSCLSCFFLELLELHEHHSRRLVRRVLQRLSRQYLYFCTTPHTLVA